MLRPERRAQRNMGSATASKGPANVDRQGWHLARRSPVFLSIAAAHCCAVLLGGWATCSARVRARRDAGSTVAGENEPR